MKYLFLDTNIWLHFKRVEDYAIADLALGVELMAIVPEIILHELDNQKDAGRTARIKDAARHVTKCIKEVSKKEGMRESGYFKNKIGLGYFMEAPTPEFIHGLGLRSEKNDDVFLASIVLFRDLRKIPPEDIIVITNDTGMHIKADSKLKMEVRELPEAYKLKDDDELQKKIKELERVVAQLSTKLPVLELMVNGSREEVCEFAINMADFDFLDVESELRSAQGAHMHMSLESGARGSLYSSIFALGYEQIEQYNNQLDNYFNDLREWLEEKCKMDWVNFVARRLVFSVSNSSFAASDAEVEIQFNSEVLLVRDLPTPKKRPAPPKQPTSRFESHLRPSLDLNDISLPNLDGVRSASVEISNDGRELKGLLGNIKSTATRSVDPVYIIPSGLNGGNLEVDFNFKVICMEAPAVTGRRIIRFKAS